MRAGLICLVFGFPHVGWGHNKISLETPSHHSISLSAWSRTFSLYFALLVFGRPKMLNDALPWLRATVLQRKENKTVLYFIFVGGLWFNIRQMSRTDTSRFYISRRIDGEFSFNSLLCCYDPDWGYRCSWALDEAMSKRLSVEVLWSKPIRVKFRWYGQLLRWNASKEICSISLMNWYFGFG